MIKQEWMTKTSARTAEDGSVDFRGFYGEYKITLQTKEGKVFTFNIRLQEREANQWEFQVGHASERGAGGGRDAAGKQLEWHWMRNHKEMLERWT
jgi:hypothetical protein